MKLMISCLLSIVLLSEVSWALAPGHWSVSPMDIQEHKPRQPKRSREGSESLKSLRREKHTQLYHQQDLLNFIATIVDWSGDDLPQNIQDVSEQRLRTYRQMLLTATSFQFDLPYVLRELIANALDSYGTEAPFENKIASVSTEKGQVVVQDYGLGMDLATLTETLLVPLRSSKSMQQSIGRFGMGFFSLLALLEDQDDFLLVHTDNAQRAFELKIYKKDSSYYFDLYQMPSRTGNQGTRVEIQSKQLTETFIEQLHRHSVHDAYAFLRQGQVLLNQKNVNQTEKIREVWSNPQGYFFFEQGLHQGQSSGKLHLLSSGVAISEVPLMGFKLQKNLALQLPSEALTTWDRQTNSIDPYRMRAVLSELVDFLLDQEKYDLLSDLYPLISNYPLLIEHIQVHCQENSKYAFLPNKPHLQHIESLGDLKPTFVHPAYLKNLNFPNALDETGSLIFVPVKIRQGSQNHVCHETHGLFVYVFVNQELFKGLNAQGDSELRDLQNLMNLKNFKKYFNAKVNVNHDFNRLNWSLFLGFFEDQSEDRESNPESTDTESIDFEFKSYVSDYLQNNYNVDNFDEGQLDALVNLFWSLQQENPVVFNMLSFGRIEPEDDNANNYLIRSVADDIVQKEIPQGQWRQTFVEPLKHLYAFYSLDFLRKLLYEDVVLQNYSERDIVSLGDDIFYEKSFPLKFQSWKDLSTMSDLYQKLKVKAQGQAQVSLEDQKISLSFLFLMIHLNPDIETKVLSLSDLQFKRMLMFFSKMLFDQDYIEHFMDSFRNGYFNGFFDLLGDSPLRELWNNDIAFERMLSNPHFVLALSKLSMDPHYTDKSVLIEKVFRKHYESPGPLLDWADESEFYIQAEHQKLLQILNGGDLEESFEPLAITYLKELLEEENDWPQIDFPKEFDDGLRLLHKDPHAQERISLREKDVRAWLKRAIGQNPRPYVFLSEMIKNAQEAQRPGRDMQIRISLGHSDGKLAMVIEDNGRGINWESLADLYVPGVSSKQSAGNDRNFGWGLFTVFNVFDELFVQSRPEGQIGLSLLMRKEQDDLLRLAYQQKSHDDLNGTRFILRSNRDFKALDYFLLLAELQKIASKTYGVTLNVQGEDLAGFSKFSIDEDSLCTVRHQNKDISIKVQLDEKHHGIYYKGHPRENLFVQSYLDWLPPSLQSQRQSIARQISVNIEGQAVQENSGRTAFLKQIEMDVLLKETIARAALVYLHRQLYEGSQHFDFISPDIYREFRYEKDGSLEQDQPDWLFWLNTASDVSLESWLGQTLVNMTPSKQQGLSLNQARMNIVRWLKQKNITDEPSGNFQRSLSEGESSELVQFIDQLDVPEHAKRFFKRNLHLKIQEFLQKSHDFQAKQVTQVDASQPLPKNIRGWLNFSEPVHLFMDFAHPKLVDMVRRSLGQINESVDIRYYCSADGALGNCTQGSGLIQLNIAYLIPKIEALFEWLKRVQMSEHQDLSVREEQQRKFRKQFAQLWFEICETLAHELVHSEERYDQKTHDLNFDRAVQRKLNHLFVLPDDSGAILKDVYHEFMSFVGKNHLFLFRARKVFELIWPELNAMNLFMELLNEQDSRGVLLGSRGSEESKEAVLGLHPEVLNALRFKGRLFLLVQELLRVKFQASGANLTKAQIFTEALKLFYEKQGVIEIQELQFVQEAFQEQLDLLERGFEKTWAHHLKKYVLALDLLIKSPNAQNLSLDQLLDPQTELTKSLKQIFDGADDLVSQSA